MVTYNYTVTYDGPTYTIQEAINHIVSDLSSNPNITSDITISVGDGTYGGFVIPSSALSVLISSSYRLVIQSAGSFFPIIDFNKSEDLNVGIDIQNNNPNVTIDGFRIQYFPVGIRASLNSHYPIIKNCILTNNRNAGILIEQCNETQVLQNIVMNGDYGIVVRLCKSAAIIHNTVFQNGAMSSTRGTTVSGIWASLAMNYGNGLADTGQLHILGNIVWNIPGTALTLFYDDIERPNAIVSNYNDLVVGNPNSYISIEDRRFYRGNESRPRRVLTSLTEWKALGHDTDSINQDPKFIAPVKIRSDRNGYAVDLNLLSLSPVLGLVPSFFVNSTATATWLPSYVDSQVFSKDILKNPRVQAGTAAGANDKATNTGFYGQDIFSNPLDINITKNCSVSPLTDIVATKLDVWFPKIKKGYFYSNDREYYLYANKKCLTLGELAVSKFRLPSKIAVTKDYSVEVNGATLDTEYYNIIGDDLYVYHKGANIVHTNEEVTVNFYTSQWSNGGFGYQPVHVVYKIHQGETKYYLPEDYITSCPVVITDDASCPTDSDYIANRQYSLVFDEAMQLTELVFAAQNNQILNSQFDYSLDNSPMFWKSESAVIIPSTSSVAGHYICEILPSGSIGQTLPWTEQNTFSFHGLGSGIRYTIKTYSHYNNDLGYVLTGSVPNSNSWHRYYIDLSTTGEPTTSFISDKPYPANLLERLYIPEETKLLDIELTNTSNSSVYIDAVQYEFGKTPTCYTRRPFLNEITVEYESDASEYYIDTRQCICPVRNYITDGFLYIPEIPASIYGGPSAPYVTTLYELNWAYGRKNIMPWARTKGKDKLSYRPAKRFHLENILKPDITVPVNTVNPVSKILLIPSIPIALQGSTSGVGISISVLDSIGSPGSFLPTTIKVDNPRGEFPGHLFKQQFGLKEQLSQTIYTKTDSAGIINLTWIPPSDEYSSITTMLPKPISSGTNRLSYIKTKYPISLVNHGNITITDSEDNTIPVSATSSITESVSTTITDNYSKVRLTYPIQYGSVKVTVGTKSFTETFVAAPDSDQFFVDYENSQILLKGNYSLLEVEYIPVYAYTTQADPYTIIIYHDLVFMGQAAGSWFNVNYDYSIPLTVLVTDPTTQQQVTNKFELIARNKSCTKIQYTNPVGLEM